MVQTTMGLCNWLINVQMAGLQFHSEVFLDGVQRQRRCSLSGPGLLRKII